MLSIGQSQYAGSPELEVVFTGEWHGSHGVSAIRISYPADAVDTQYQWSFGDGTAGVGRSVTHTYGSEGYFVVELTYTSESGGIYRAVTGVLVSSATSVDYPVQVWENVDAEDGRLLDRLEVSLSPGTTFSEAVSLFASLPVSIISWCERTGFFEVMIEAGTQSTTIRNELATLPDVLAVGDACILYDVVYQDVPDELYHEQLGHGLNTLRSEKGRSQIGSHAVTVAVIDTGYDTDHPEFQGLSIDAIVIPSSATIEDEDGHGTEVLGVIAARHGNGWITGLAPASAEFVCAKVDDTAASLAKGIRAAVDTGADVINVSKGGYFDVLSLKSACEYAASAGCLVIAGAGNDGRNALMYPAAYGSVLPVGGTTVTDGRSMSSNYHAEAVYAPYILYTTHMGGDAVTAAGTSIAAPAVASLAACILATDPTLSAEDVRAIIELTSDPVAFAGIGRVNFHRAIVRAKDGVTLGPDPLPGQVRQLVAEATAYGTVLEWANPPDPDFVGTRIYRSPITANRDPLHLIATESATGDAHRFVDSPLAEGVHYGYYIFAVDSTGLMSAVYDDAYATGVAHGLQPDGGTVTDRTIPFSWPALGDAIGYVFEVRLNTDFGVMDSNVILTDAFGSHFTEFPLDLAWYKPASIGKRLYWGVRPVYGGSSSDAILGKWSGPASFVYDPWPLPVRDIIMEIDVTPNPLVADGTSTAQVTARVLDAGGNPIANQQVRFINWPRYFLGGIWPGGGFKPITNLETTFTNSEGYAYVTYYAPASLDRFIDPPGVTLGVYYNVDGGGNPYVSTMLELRSP